MSVGLKWKLITPGVHQFTGSDIPRHGFFGKPFDAAQDTGRRMIEEKIGKKLFLLNQVHGSRVIIPGMAGDADGVVMERQRKTDEVLGICTADCLPILLFSKSMVGAVHAGWRGLAAGIVEQALANFPSSEAVTGLIGPAAGDAAYEVGKDVLDTFGDAAQFLPADRPDKYLFSLSRTLEKLITRNRDNISVVFSNVCTIQNSVWHSHRREGVLRGSNLSWIDPGDE